jgi:hypothetical protein
MKEIWGALQTFPRATTSAEGVATLRPDTNERITFDGLVAHDFGDLVDRFVVHERGRWSLATYLFPSGAGQAARMQEVVSAVDPSQILTGLTLVNRELARSFVPQFIKGLAIGTALVMALVIAAFRNWRLSIYAVLPTAIGLTWAAALVHISTDFVFDGEKVLLRRDRRTRAARRIRPIQAGR